MPTTAGNRRTAHLGRLAPHHRTCWPHGVPVSRRASEPTPHGDPRPVAAPAAAAVDHAPQDPSGPACAQPMGGPLQQLEPLQRQPRREGLRQRRGRQGCDGTRGSGLGCPPPYGRSSPTPAVRPQYATAVSPYARQPHHETATPPYAHQPHHETATPPYAHQPHHETATPPYAHQPHHETATPPYAHQPHHETATPPYAHQPHHETATPPYAHQPHHETATPPWAVLSVWPGAMTWRRIQRGACASCPPLILTWSHSARCPSGGARAPASSDSVAWSAAYRAGNDRGPRQSGAL